MKIYQDVELTRNIHDGRERYLGGRPFFKSDKDRPERIKIYSRKELLCKKILISSAQISRRRSNGHKNS